MVHGDVASCAGRDEDRAAVDDGQRSPTRPAVRRPWSDAARSATRDAQPGQRGPACRIHSDPPRWTSNGRERSLLPQCRGRGHRRDQSERDQCGRSAWQHRFGDGIWRPGRRTARDVRMVHRVRRQVRRRIGHDRVRRVGWVRFETRQRPLRTDDHDPEREEQRDDCAPSLPITHACVPHDVADCSSGPLPHTRASEMTPCCYRPAIGPHLRATGSCQDVRNARTGCQ